MNTSHVISLDGTKGKITLSPRSRRKSLGGEPVQAANNSTAEADMPVSPRSRQSRLPAARALKKLHLELYHLQRTFLLAGRRQKQKRAKLKVQISSMEADIRLKYFELQEELAIHKNKHAPRPSMPSPPSFIPQQTPRGMYKDLPTLPRPPARQIANASLPTMGSPLEVGGPPEGFEPEPTDGCLKVGYHISETHCWTTSPPGQFELRRADYLKKKKKYKCEKSMFELVGVDVFKSVEEVPRAALWEGSVFSKAKRNSAATGEPMRRYLIVNFMCPGEPNFNLVNYFAEKDFPIETEEDRNYKRLVDNFMTTENNKFRKKRFKIIPHCTKGPWVVKKAMGSPALIAKKLETSWNLGEGYLEVTVDVGSSMVAKRILGTVLGALTSLVIDLGFTIEGTTEAELPERLIGGCRMQYMDMEALQIKEQIHGRYAKKDYGVRV